MKSTIPHGAKDTVRSTDRRSAPRVRSERVRRCGPTYNFWCPSRRHNPKFESWRERRAASPPPTPPTPTARGASARHHRPIASTHRCGKSSAHPFAARHRSTMADATRRCQRGRCTSGAPHATRSPPLPSRALVPHCAASRYYLWATRLYSNYSYRLPSYSTRSSAAAPKRRRRSRR